MTAKTWTTLPLKCDRCDYQTHVYDAMIEHVQRHRAATQAREAGSGE